MGICIKNHILLGFILLSVVGNIGTGIRNLPDEYQKDIEKAGKKRLIIATYHIKESVITRLHVIKTLRGGKFLDYRDDISEYEVFGLSR